MLLRELLENQEKVTQFFAGQNLDSEVRLAVDPGVVTVAFDEPAKDGE